MCTVRRWGKVLRNWWGKLLRTDNRLAASPLAYARNAMRKLRGAPAPNPCFHWLFAEITNAVAQQGAHAAGSFLGRASPASVTSR